MPKPPTPSYPIAQRTLGNGLRVIVSEDHTAPIAALNLWYDVGSKDEAPGQTGFAHLFEHLMFQGSANVERGEHLAALQAAGATVNATTSFDRTNYFASGPVGALDLALWLEADRLASLAITPANVDNQREVVKEEKRQRYDNVPYGEAMAEILRLALPAGHPYAHTVIGSMADLDAATPADAQAFFDVHYNPGNAVLTIVGDVAAEDAFTRADRYFGGIPAHPAPTRVVPDPLPPLTGVPRADLVRDVPSAAVYCLWRLPAQGQRAFDVCQLALDILGAGPASRLHRRLVLGSQTSAGTGTSALGLVGGNSLGFAVAHALPGASLESLEADLLDEVERLASDGPTPEELDRQLAQFEREWFGELARIASRADQLSGFALLHGDPAIINRRLADLSTITAAEVADAARTWLRPENRAVLTFTQETA